MSQTTKVICGCPVQECEWFAIPVPVLVEPGWTAVCGCGAPLVLLPDGGLGVTKLEVD